ncbi:MAG: hypothetical protein MSH37_14835 [Shigella dysenteriae]|nr:hypothetical protein [Shigella dysenteriae]
MSRFIFYKIILSKQKDV